tara:strand:- start:268 stop:447 length:180 start_codon:yes stop_codon:yes gene_type:complete
MATKQEVADYINNINILDTLTDSELVHIQERVDPLLANALIKIVGDVSWLVEIRDHESN